jgi:tetratricopeptide (TPR) repeat protein
MELNPIKIFLRIFTSKVFFASGIILILSIQAFILFSEKKGLHRDLNNAKEMLKRAEDEIARVQTEKGLLVKEKEKLQADAISCLGGNTKLQAEKDALEADLQGARKKIAENETQLQRVKSEYEVMNKKPVVKESGGEPAKLMKEKEILKDKVDALTATLKQERARHHYNLGVIYTQSKSYDEALREFLKSLSLEPNNPEAHYNLGLLYGNIKEDSTKAAIHFNKYLKLKPNAADKEEVASWIRK